MFGMTQVLLFFFIFRKIHSLKIYNNHNKEPQNERPRSMLTYW